MWYTHTKPVVLMLCLIVPNPFKMCVHCVIVARCLGPSMYQVETYEIQISVCVQYGIQLQACFDDKDSQKPKNNSPSNWALFNDSIILGKMRKIQKTGWKYREIHWQMSLRFCWPRVLFFIDNKKTVNDTLKAINWEVQSQYSQTARTMGNMYDKRCSKLFIVLSNCKKKNSF